MKKRYDSIEFEYTRFMHFRITIQRDNDSINIYYEPFRHMLNR